MPQASSCEPGACGSTGSTLFTDLDGTLLGSQGQVHS